MFSPQKKKLITWDDGGLANARVIIKLQYITVSNHHTTHPKFIPCYVSIPLQRSWGKISKGQTEEKSIWKPHVVEIWLNIS